MNSGSNDNSVIERDTVGMKSSTQTPTPSHTVPPHIAWPALVIFLLLLSVGVSFAALWAANSDGGAILVRDPNEQFSP